MFASFNSFDIFGDDATPKVEKFIKVEQKLNTIAKETGRSCRLLGLVGSSARQFLQQMLKENNGSYTKSAMKTRVGSKQEIYAGASKRALADKWHADQWLPNGPNIS
ncbi:Metacaspase-5 [Abeliophyllum distichum]|uniref:Metacaspase-5 n=1 Tax=Abeliophyllum distichum TaxID=126358 RepID=A0ABD1QLM9_9LAMI